jgi:hypothetical protein
LTDVIWHEITTGGDSPETLFEAELADGNRYVLTEKAAKKIKKLAADKQEEAVRAAVAESAADWAKNRGPDSPLGRGMEAGTPAPSSNGE